MRHFTWCRLEIAANCRCSSKHFHICINGPEGRTIQPTCPDRTVLHQFFDDLDPEAMRRTEAYAKDPVWGEERAKRCFTEAQAREMVAFVKSTPDDAIIIVNCEAGISRSPGAVLAFRRFYGGDVDEPFQKAHPNIHVTSVLSKVLREAVC